MARDYRKEYDNYQGKPSQIANRSSRNKARRKAKKNGYNVKGRDVHHKDGNPNNNSLSNLSIASKSYNRSKNKQSRA
tara:strand:+ start:419 stop:649 length:231 start_codon:yes stop_codon:yes gene_type:complete